MERNDHDENQYACPDLNTLATFLEGSLDDEEQQVVDSHLRVCQRCREIFTFGERSRQSQVALSASQTQSTDLDPLLQKLMPFGQLSTGQTIGRYIIITPLGLGGMGEVYSAYDPELNRRVALKLLRTDVYADSTMDSNVSRLLKEAQAMAQLSHPNVISIYDVMKVDGRVVIAMEYFSGGTLKSWLQDQTRTWREIVDRFVLAGRGLAAAHAAKLVHRDFKPANVLLEKDGRVCVTDFGLVRGLDQDENPTPLESLAPNRLEESITMTGAFVGTPAYMSPEQLQGEKSDTRSDQFCFCVSLFEAVYGKRPYLGETPAEVKTSIMTGQISPVEPSSNVPGWLYNVVKRGLAISPEDRYPSMVKLLQYLENDPNKIAKQKRTVRNRKLLMISLVLLAIILPVGVWYGLQYRRVQMCKDTSAEFVGIWDNPTKNAVRSVFLETKKSFAKETWQLIERHLNTYLAEWVQMRSDICESKHIRGTQSEELFDLRMGCLKDRKQELQALSGIFTKADTGVVLRAIQASASLTDISLCADEEALRAPYPPPKTAEAKVKVAAIREKLSEVEAFHKTGKYPKGLALAQRLEKEAIEFAYQPVKAEILYWLGVLLARTGDPTKAEVALFDAARLAGESRDALLTAKAMVKLVWVIGDGQAKHEKGLLVGRAAKLMLGVAGGEQAVLAELLNNMGAAFKNQGNYDKALEYYRESLVIKEKIRGPENPFVATTLNNMGEVFRLQENHRMARDYYQKALNMYRNTLGSKHPYVGKLLHNLGVIFSTQADLDNALKYYRKSLAIFEEVLGSEHPYVATSLNNLGVQYKRRGEYDMALEQYRRALKIMKKTLDSNHPDVATAMGNICFIFLKKGDSDKAHEYCGKSLEIRQEALGPEHIKVASALNKMGEVLLHQGKLNEALESHGKALAIQEKAMGPEFLGLAESLNAIGTVLVRQGKYKRSLQYSRRSLAINEKTLGPDHPAIADSLATMARALYGLGKLDKAYGHIRRALAIREEKLGPEHPSVTVFLTNIGRILIAQRMPQKAIEPLERAVAICEKKKCSHDSFGLGLFNLARALVLTGGDKDRATKLAVRAQKVLGEKPKAFKKERKEVEAWLKKHAQVIH